MIRGVKVKMYTSMCFVPFNFGLALAFERAYEPDPCMVRQGRTQAQVESDLGRPKGIKTIGSDTFATYDFNPSKDRYSVDQILKQDTLTLFNIGCKEARGRFAERRDTYAPSELEITYDESHKIKSLSERKSGSTYNERKA